MIILQQCYKLIVINYKDIFKPLEKIIRKLK